MNTHLLRITNEYSKLVNEMLDQFPESDWKSKTTTFYDPDIGGGQFVKEVESRLLTYGHSPANISKRVYGYGIWAKVVSRELYGNYVNKNIFEEPPKMRFDVALGNAPFSEGNTDQEGRFSKNLRRQHKSLAKRFTLEALDIADKVAMIMPYNSKTYSSGIKKFYKEKGLYFIKDVCEYFPQVNTNACAFFFDKDKKEFFDEKEPDFPKPQKSLADIFVPRVGCLYRNEYEHKLLNNGKFKIIVTLNNIKFTNDKNLVEKMNDKTTNMWRVVINTNNGGNTFGKAMIVEPSVILGKSVSCFCVGSKKEAELLKTYLETDEVQNIIARVKPKSATSNSKKYFEYVPYVE